MGHQLGQEEKLLPAHFQFVPQKSRMVAHLRLALKLTRAPRCDSTSCSPAQFQCQPKICHYTTFFKYGHQTVFFAAAWTGVSKALRRLQRLGTKPWNKKGSPSIYIQPDTLQELYEVLDLRNQREMSVIEFRVQLKKVWTVWDKTDLSFCQLDFPVGKMVSYSKFKECHLDLSSFKRSAAFLDKLEMTTYRLITFLKQWSVVSSHDQSCQQYNAAESFPLDVPVDINLITAAYLPEESIPSTALIFN